MKFLIPIATAFAAMACSAHAETMPSDAWRVYASGGYTFAATKEDSTSINLGALTARLGARYGSHFGVEAEGSFGVADDNISGVKVKLDHQYAAYAVAFLPLTPEVDLIGRIGYGNAKISASGASFSGSDSSNTWNVGVGGQFSFDRHSALRMDFTRHESTKSSSSHYDTGTFSYVYRF